MESPDPLNTPSPESTRLRRKAEDRLDDKQAAPAASPTDADARALVHELQVHQIELEMQNEELLRARAAEQEISGRYQDLFDFAPSGYFLLDAHGRIRELNLAGATLLELDRDAALRRRFAEFVAPPCLASFAEFLRDVRQSCQKQTIEIELAGKGEPICAGLEGVLAEDEAGNASFRITVTDITERKRMEEAQTFLLQCGRPGSSEGFFQALARYLARTLRMDFVCIDRLLPDELTAQTVAIYSAGRFEEDVTYALKDTPCGDVVGKTVCCFPKDVRRLFPKDEVLQSLKAESYVGTTLWSFDGRPIGLIAIIAARPLAQPRLAERMLKLVALRAAGELERLQADEALRELNRTLEQRVAERTAEIEKRMAQLHVLAAELTQTEQRERRRLAEILHDHLQQLLVAARMKVELLARRVADDRFPKTIAQLDDLLKQTIDESRSLAVELCPPVLYTYGLAAGLEWLARDLEEKFGLAVEVVADPAAEPVEETSRVLLFQAVSELLLNAAKHSGSKLARVRMHANAQQHTCIEVRDEGVGFDPALAVAGPTGGGFGTFSIRMRLEVLGGQMEVASHPGQGTEVTIRLPRESANATQP